MIDTEFWRGRRVLVTGHTGFKGGWLSLWLQQMEAELAGLALAPPTTPSLFELAAVGSGMDSRIGDIRSYDAVRDAMNGFAPEIVFHLAAQPIVRASYEDPIETYATNVMGTVHVLEAARHAPSVKVVVNVTSDKCYENPNWHWGCREIDPMGGHDPYSSSKGCAELVASAFRRSYFEKGTRCLALGSVRAGNVFGGGDWARDRLIPDLIRAIGACQSMMVRNPDATRPWQHVLEPLSGYIMLAEKLWSDGPRYQGGWNFGPLDADARPVHEVLGALCANLGPKARWHVERDPNAPHEAKILHLDITKARRELGYEPRWSLQRGLAETASWYDSAMAGADMRRITLDQIESFSTRTSLIQNTMGATQ